MNTIEFPAVLHDRLLCWPLSGADAPHAFEDRLADDCGWTRGFASRVVVEYRRFLQLSQMAGHTVTPSREVDAAWHLHLTHTRGYSSRRRVSVRTGPRHRRRRRVNCWT